MALSALGVTFTSYSLPYVYYQLLNWVVLGAALVTANHAHDKNRPLLMWVFIILAVIFNPVAPFYLSPIAWHVLDLVAAGLFYASFLLIRAKK